MNKLHLIFPLFIILYGKSFAQTADDLINYTMDLFHQSDTDPEDNGNEKFLFGANGQASSYDADDGEWESLKFSFLQEEVQTGNLSSIGVVVMQS